MKAVISADVHRAVKVYLSLSLMSEQLVNVDPMLAFFFFPVVRTCWVFFLFFPKESDRVRT